MVFPLPVPPHIVVVTPGLVRNLLKQTFHLRIPSDRDRPSRTHHIEQSGSLELDSQDWYLIEDNLLQLDRDHVLKIVRYPNYVAPPAPSGPGIVFVDGPTPPADQTNYWISSITGDYYAWDSTINMWRSLSPKVIPFFRNKSQGTPLAPFGTNYTSYAMWVNSTVDRTYIMNKAFVYVDDGTALPRNHTLTLESPATADQTVTIVNRVTTEIVPTTRLIAPAGTLSVRHGTDIMAIYIQANVEFSHVVP